MKNVKNRREKGITLIALVITIVVLIILATISINAVIGQGGIIEKAKEAKNLHDEGQSEEETKLEEAANSIAQYYTMVDKSWDSTKVDTVKSSDNINVPVPKGYVASTVPTETRVSTGFVIKQGTDGSKTEGINEFVWVPVSNISDIYDEVNKAGQLWDLSETTSTKITYPTTQNSGYREPDVVVGTGAQYDAVAGNLSQAGLESSATASDFKAQLQNEFDKMIKSVKEYGGFYIGRFEAGVDSTTLRAAATVAQTVVCKKGVAPYNYVPWGANTNDASEVQGASGAVYLARNMYKTSDSVTSTLIYGCQWDAMCRYIGDCQRTTPKKSAPERTGSIEKDVSKNIYDLAGNCWEWTMEAYGEYRVLRGGDLYTATTIAARTKTFVSNKGNYSTFRPTLYIK